MKNKGLIGMLLFVLVFACNPVRRIESSRPANTSAFSMFCDTVKEYKTLYIRHISADLFLDDKEYEAKISLYYVPDSILFLSATNSGFEIVRAAITKDSTVYINRLDKIIYVYKAKGVGYSDPLSFDDIETLLNRPRLCQTKGLDLSGENSVFIDHSLDDIKRTINFSATPFRLNDFEFFHKKTGEYLVGTRNEMDQMVFYSNFIVDNIKLIAEGGRVEYDRKIKIDLSVNMNKYLLLEL